MTDAFAPNVDDFADYVQQRQDSAVRRAMPTDETDPEKAARAQELSDYTGLHPALVRGNLDNVESQFRSELTNGLIQRNKHLQDYINSHPLAAETSSDDWGNLDNVSQRVSAIPKDSGLLVGIRQFSQRFNQVADDSVTTAAKDFVREPLGSWIPEPQRVEMMKSAQGRINYALAAMIGSPIELPLRGFNSILAGIGEATKQTTKAMGASDEEAERQSARMQEFLGVGMMHLGSTGIHVPGELNAVAKRAKRAVDAASPYVKAGLEPPVGVDAAIDQIKGEQAKLDADTLRDALAEAQKSNTRERNPELFRSFIAQHTDAEIGISWEAVRALYGDSVPMPDDGLLGFVPGIEDQLLGAEHGGGDIKVPLADWLAHADPDVAKALHDHIRVRGNGLTLDETKNLPKVEMDEDLFQPPGPKAEEGSDQEIAQLRARLDGDTRTPAFQKEVEQTVRTVEDSAGLGPATKLKRVSQGTRQFANVHDFDFVDKDGKSVGDIQLTFDQAKKDLHVEYVRHDQGPQAFGPRAIRDIYRQLKEAFPEAKTISGTRVSGAREKALQDKAEARKQSSTPVSYDEWRRLTGHDDTPEAKYEYDHTSHYQEGIGGWQDVSVPLHQAGDLISDLTEFASRFGVDMDNFVDLGKGVQAVLTDKFTEKEQVINDAVDATVKKIIPRLVDVMGVKKLRYGKDQPSLGMFVTRQTRIPIIAWSMEGADPVGSIRHEAIHHLRRTGFFTPEEWRTLRDAAITEEWGKKYNIQKRYKGEGLASQLEESVAEHFAHWNRNEYKAGMQEPPEGVTKIMYKLAQLYHAVRTAVRSVLGEKADWQDIFQKVESGEVGSRRGVEPIQKDAFRGPTYQIPEQGELGVTRIEDQALFAKANAVGMTVKSYKQLLENIAKKDAEDNEFAKKQNLKNVERRQTEEWKTNEKRIRDEVRPDYENRPDLAADKFFREGVLYGDKVKGRPRLDSNKLTKEQKDALPADYHTPGGLHPDDAAGLFGYDSGDTLVSKLAELHANREEAKLSPARYLSKLVDDEVERRMRAEHGELEKNILDEAQEHVISQTQFDMLHEETLALATKAGMEMSLTKEDMKAMAVQGFEGMQVKNLRSEEFLRNALRANELAERALLDGDPKEAFAQKQKQMFSFLYAREAKRFEREQKKFNRLVKKYTDRQPSGVEPEYTNYIHELMQRFGIGIKRTPQDVATEISQLGHGDLKQFIESKNGDYGALAVDDRLYDPGFKPQIGSMKVDEFRAVNDALIVLDKASRDEKKVIREGAKEDLAKVVDAGVTQLETRPMKEYSLKQGRLHGLSQLAKKYATVGILNVETWVDRFDRDNTHGMFNQWLMRPLSSAANRENTLGREFGVMYRDLGEVKDADKRVDSPLIDPLSRTRDDPDGRAYSGFTRKNIAAMISNAGNEYNWDVLTKGHEADPELTKQWLINKSTKEDWIRAEKMGKIFGRAFEMAQDVYRNIYGVAPPKIELKPFDISWPNGETFHSEGWYHPIIKDEKRTNLIRSARGDDLLDKDRGLFPSIANGYTKRRTGAIDVLSLDHDMVVPRLNQVLHDIAFRAEMIEAAKIVKNKEFRKALRQYAGEQFVPMFDNWLANVAGAQNIQYGIMADVARASNYARTNVIGSLIGGNPSTVFKHGPTAAYNSMYQVGMRNFIKSFGETVPSYLLDSVTDLFVRDQDFADRQWNFAKENSEELQRRERNWQETIGGASKIIEGKSTLREKILYWGAKPVALSDMLSAIPTWLAAYKTEMEATGIHGDAVYAGDKAVRKAHGSTAVTNLPELVHQAGPFGGWLTTLYGFFSAQMQRRAEIAFKLNDTYHLARDSELKAASKTLASTIPLIFSAVIVPTIIEEYVTGIGTDDRRGWGQRALYGIIGGMANSFLYFRDLAHGVTTGQEPSIGMATTVAHDFTNVFKEVAHPIKALDRNHAAKTVSDFITAFGEATGLAPRQVAKVVRFGLGNTLGTEHPKGPQDVGVGLMRGTAKRRIER